MANNRLYLRCKGCGCCIMLGKHFAGPWHAWSTREQLNNWFDYHFGCGSMAIDHGLENLELLCEMDDDFEAKYKPAYDFPYDMSYQEGDE